MNYLVGRHQQRKSDPLPCGGAQAGLERGYLQLNPLEGQANFSKSRTAPGGRKRKSLQISRICVCVPREQPVIYLIWVPAERWQCASQGRDPLAGGTLGWPAPIISQLAPTRRASLAHALHGNGQKIHRR